ncbi:AfsR/SARP family transcriptional regulator [Plantactinospora sp. CA-290183]|uniref:AfsR/SARP family transcriptional regulator n=1 Tax=Plantactinospora sp. CA-290183 TaxID=3240006 RepID=UPI003D91E9E9
MGDVKRMPSDVSSPAFGVLGPLEVAVDGRRVPVRSPKQRSLLAGLLLNAGRSVPLGELATVIWGPEQPANPRCGVQVCATRLRALLAEAGCPQIILTSTDGYLIDVPQEQVDLGRFHRWLAEADQAAGQSDAVREAAALRAALAQWRADPLADVRSEALQREAVPRLWAQRLNALERRFDAELRLGRYAEIIDELFETVAREPLRERFWGQLMTALHRDGRRADALAAYHEARRHLAEELGIDPGDDLRRRHAEVLAGTEAGSVGVVLPVVPRQLPSEAPAFTGRAREVAELTNLLAGRGMRGGPGSPTVVVVSGTAGVGKTALALHWARRVADRFPDGQLWLNLRGYDHRPAMTTQQALTLLLRALGVPDADVPPDVDSQSGLYRSLMDGRRALVVLDNAGTAEQLRPLLPGSPDSLTLLTSRDQLTGLVAIDGAHAIELELFTAEEGLELLVRRLGAARIATEPVAAREVVERCARLPLALAIAAARAAQRPRLRLAALAGQLRSARERLDEFSSPDIATDPRAVFSWSYRSLGVPAARLFRRLGAHPGPDISVTALACLVGAPIERVRQPLAELSRAHLLVEQDDGRYTLHDLLRAYAAELASSHDKPPDRRSSLRRLLDHYLHTGHVAARLIEPLRDPLVLPPSAAGVTIRPPATREAALTWFADEYAGLLAAIECAAGAGFDTHTWQLVWTLADFQQWRGHWHDRAALLRMALETTRRLGNRAEQARAHRGLGYAYTRLGRDDDAHTHLRHALDLYVRLADQVGEARAHHGLSYVLERQGNHHGALWHAQRALDRYPADGHRAHRARAVGSVAWCHARLGDHHQTLHHCIQALSLLCGTGDRVAEAATWDSLGYARHHLGDHHRAVVCFRTALRLRRELGHRTGEANTLVHLGDTFQAMGDRPGARGVWNEALRVLDQLGGDESVRVRTRLAALGSEPA